MTHYFKDKDAMFPQIAKIPTILTAVNGDIVSPTICLERKVLVNQKEQSRMEPVANVEMIRIVPHGLQVVAPLDIAGEVLRSGIGMAALDPPLIPNLVVNNPNGSRIMPKVEGAEIRNIMEKLKMTTDKLM